MEQAQEAVRPARIPSSSHFEPSTGQRFYRLDIGQRHYLVRADLLCARSAFFQAMLQHSPRKDVEGECLICCEDLQDPEQTTFCVKCGINFHIQCILQWHDTQKTCPHCREAWVEPAAVARFPELEPLGFEVFQTWLQEGHISLPEEDHRPRWCRLMEAHRVGEGFENADFQQAVRRTMVECTLANRAFMGWQAFFVVESKFPDGHILKRFLATLYSGLQAVNNSDDAIRQLIVQAGHINSGGAFPED